MSVVRLMGDATHDNVAALAKNTWALVGGYDTGTPDIQWVPADWQQFPDIPHVDIDQGFTGSPVASSNVRDVERGAWSVADAVNLNGWTAPRPTIYCNQSTLPAVINAGWTGDVWLAKVETEPTLPPVIDGVNVVAVQFDLGVKGEYDMSAVFDPYWPALPPAGPRRILADGFHTVGHYAQNHKMTVHGLIKQTCDKQPHGLGPLQRQMLDHMANVKPPIGTTLWV